MNQARIQPAAAADADEAATWYETLRDGLGIEFLLELDVAIGRATDAPMSYEDQYLGVRRVLMERFPYSVYFTFEGAMVEIIAVLHQHQSPNTWQSRV